MGTYVNKAIGPYDGLFDNECVIKLTEPHKAGDIINDRIILTDYVYSGKKRPTEEEFNQVVYPAGYYVKTASIDKIDDIVTPTDMRPYGFTQVDDNRYCKSNVAIGWALAEVRCKITS